MPLILVTQATTSSPKTSHRLSVETFTRSIAQRTQIPTTAQTKPASSERTSLWTPLISPSQIQNGARAVTMNSIAIALIRCLPAFNPRLRAIRLLTTTPMSSIRCPEKNDYPTTRSLRITIVTSCLKSITSRPTQTLLFYSGETQNR